ncbi:MAG: uroporphyrinogen decarboxylase family protein [Candidatus Latescibacterota bacterium]
MTERDRFHETMRFGNPDHPPYRELEPWPETFDRWYTEGLPKRADFKTYFGFDRYDPVGIDEEIHPVFREEVLEETDNDIIKNDWRGVKLKLSKSSRSIPFFYRFPVTDRESFRKFTAHLNPDSPDRYPLFWDIRVKELQNRTYPVYFGSGRTIGFFGPIREWVGPENLLVGFYDDPAWVHEMMDYYADFLIRLTTPMLRDVTPDCIHFFEDMAYRAGSLISPEFFRTFMMEPYKRVLDHFRKNGVPFFVVDSDGKIDELIPLFLELGIEAVYPFEVQAGMDILKIREKYGRDLVIWGGLDKRKLTGSKKDIETEVYSIVPNMLEQGGYIPTLDHEAPPDIPFENFCYYRQLVRKVCEE